MCLKKIPSESIDMTITSPPYDSLRTYSNNETNWTYDKFKAIANQLYRVTKNGGVVVWIVSDETINGSESGTSFRQALYFKEIGFNIHDTMIWNKGGFSAVGALKTRYAPVFEYMFIFSKGKIKTFNPINDHVNKISGKIIQKTKRLADGTVRKGKSYISNEFGRRYNIWEIFPQRQRGKDVHPAPFPEELVSDHIISWSNIGDVILDPFMGSGTTAISCIKLKRQCIGIELNQHYCEMTRDRIHKFNKLI